MAFLVTGGCGYIGSHMVLALQDQGEKVVVIDNLTTGFRDAITSDTRLVQADIADRAALDGLFRANDIEAILHFAASTVAAESMADPLAYYRNNTIKAHALLAAAVNAGVRRFVLSSTAAVYGTPVGMGVSEADAPNPSSPYGASKLFFEHILTDTAKAHGLSTAILRYFNVAGADPNGRCGKSTAQATHLIKRCCQAALGLVDGVDVFGADYPTPDGTGVRDYIHVTDLIAAHTLALKALGARADGLLFNCGYGRGFSVFEVIASVKRVSGVDFPVRVQSRRPGDVGQVIAHADRLRSELGWSPQFDDLDTIVGHDLAWERRLAGQA